MRKLSPFVLAFLVACIGSSAGPRLGISSASGALPAMSGPTLQGGSVSPADYRGMVVVVNVWATWCGPCRREQPGLERVWESYRDRGVYFLGVDYRDDPAAARTWIDQFRVTYPSVADPAGSYADDFGFVGLPDTYLADRSGQLRYRVTGAADPTELAKLIDQLLGSST